MIRMGTIRLTGRIKENGQLEIDQPTNLPPGEVRITIEPISPEEDAADEALWETQFAGSQSILERLAQEAHEEHLAGLTEDFDPDDDEL